MNIINIGIYPPPFGGVSNHLKRLLDFLHFNKINSLLLDVSDDIKYNVHDVINIRSFKLLLFLLFRTHRSIVHLHYTSIKSLIMMYLISFRHATMISFHNERFVETLKEKGKFLFSICKYILVRVDRIIVNTENNRIKVLSIVNSYSNIEVIPEFIPPSNIPFIEDGIINKFRSNHKYILSSNAYQLSFHKGEDLYGIDILIEMMGIIAYEKGLDAVMIFLLPRIGNKEYFEDLLMQIKKRDLVERFIFITDPLEEASSLWQLSDVVIRATNTDGNSMTILEALSLKIPTIASDCVERPQGVILFKSRNMHDLIDKTLNVLSNIKLEKEKLRNLEIENNAEKILNAYKDLWRSKEM